MNRFNHNSSMAVVTQTDSPKSVHNRSVIDVLMAFRYCVLFIFCWKDGFCHRTEADIILLPHGLDPSTTMCTLFLKYCL